MNRLSPILATYALLGTLALTTGQGLYGAPDSGFFTSDKVWTDDTGQSRSLDAFKGRRVVMTMAYADCDRICPMSLETMKDLDARFRKKKEDVTFIVFTLNPDRDTVEAMATMRKHLEVGANWVFLRGSAATTESMAKQLELGKIYLDDHILHKFKIWSLNKDGQVEKVFDWNHRKLENYP